MLYFFFLPSFFYYFSTFLKNEEIETKKCKYCFETNTIEKGNKASLISHWMSLLSPWFALYKSHMHNVCKKMGQNCSILLFIVQRPRNSVGHFLGALRIHFKYEWSALRTCWLLFRKDWNSPDSGNLLWPRKAISRFHAFIYELVIGSIVTWKNRGIWVCSGKVAHKTS